MWPHIKCSSLSITCLTPHDHVFHLPKNRDPSSICSMVILDESSKSLESGWWRGVQPVWLSCYRQKFAFYPTLSDSIMHIPSCVPSLHWRNMMFHWVLHVFLLLQYSRSFVYHFVQISAKLTLIYLVSLQNCSRIWSSAVMNNINALSQTRYKVDLIVTVPSATYQTIHNNIKRSILKMVNRNKIYSVEQYWGWIWV